MAQEAAITEKEGSETGLVVHGSNLPATMNVDFDRLLRIFLSNKSEKTLSAYKKDLIDFSRFMGVTDGNIDTAARMLLSQGRGHANSLAAEYREHLESRKLAPATINRRLAALRSLVEQAGTLGLVNWELSIKGPKTRPYRDTQGPGVSNFRKMLGQVESRKDNKGIRDVALLRLMYDLALRRGEVVSLDVEDVNISSGTLAVLGKGRTEKELLTLPEPTMTALRSWIGVRGDHDGPLFTNMDRAGKGERLTGTAVYQIVRKLGVELGIKTRPHGIRHSSITACVEQFPLNDVQKFSRHRKLETLALYLDQKDGGAAAKISTFVSHSV